MNKFEAERSFAERMKRCYPPGTRLVLLSMDDPYAPNLKLIPNRLKQLNEYMSDFSQVTALQKSQMI